MFSPEDFTTVGSLDKNASKVVLKCLWVARNVRPDLLWTVNALARQLTKWNRACDIRLKRLMGYMKGTREKVIVSYIGDALSECKLAMFSDASYAADVQDSKSMSGMYIALVLSENLLPDYILDEETNTSVKVIGRS